MTHTIPFQQTSDGCKVTGTRRWEVDAEGVRVGMHVARSRSVPWLNIVRVPRFGRGIPAEEVPAVVEALLRLIRARPVLRLHVEIWSEDDQERIRLRSACSNYGFRQVPDPRSYGRTIWMDLSGTEEELMARFHATGRRHIRAPAKKGYEVRPIVSPDVSTRLAEIFRETFERTGGNQPPVRWPDTIRLAAAAESRCRLVGLFRADDKSSQEPLSFALGILHGEVAEYAHAGSVRDASIRVPLLYAPTWELMRWARARGARWWDFGGVTEAHHNGDGPGRISDFKRYFSRDERDVGEEWVFEPRPFFAAMARLPRSLRRILRG